MQNPQPLRLMLVCAGNGPGGAEMNFLRTCQAFHKQGPDKVALLPVVRRKTWLAERLAAENIPFKAAPFGGFFDFATRMCMRKHIFRHKPHIVQCWMNRAVSKTPKVKGIPLVGRLGGYYKLKNYTHTDHLVANAQGIVSYLKEGGWAPGDMTLVQNFASFPPDDFTKLRDEVRRHYNLAQEAVVLFSSSRLHPHKGQETILRALAKLPERVHYMAAGSGPDEQMLKDLAEELNITPRVHFLGWVNNISPLCAAADIFVVSSRIEPLGNVVLDAWAHGKPLVTSAASGPVEIVSDGTNGLIYPIDDAQALADKISYLVDNPSVAADLAAAGHEHVRTHYAEDVIIDKYMTLYHRLLAERESVVK